MIHNSPWVHRLEFDLWIQRALVPGKYESASCESSLVRNHGVVADHSQDAC